MYIPLESRDEASVRKLENVLEALKLEILEHPQYWTAYDSLAGIYLALGETHLAIQNYEKSIELNPANQNAVERLKKLKDQS